MYFDSHAHLTEDCFAQDFDSIVENMKAASVTGMMEIGFDLPSSEKAVQLAERFSWVHAAVGSHPDDAAQVDEARIAVYRELCKNPRVKAIGEIGLDYHMDYDDDIAPAPHSVQIDCMARQLEVAVRRNVPVELHLRHEDSDGERNSHVDAYNVLREMGVPQAGCVLHCFGEDRTTMERFVELGCHIAYGGAATFKRNDDVREAFAATPLGRILFETDCPYMAPEPIRGLECEPAMISITANALVNDRVDRTGEDAETIAQAAWENACKLFQK